MKGVVDNIATHAVESMLITSLGDIISPASVMRMKPEQVSMIAAESAENQAQRDQLGRRLAVLEAGIETCKRYAVRRSLGNSLQTMTSLQKLTASSPAEAPTAHATVRYHIIWKRD